MLTSNTPEPMLEFYNLLVVTAPARFVECISLYLLNAGLCKSSHMNVRSQCLKHDLEGRHCESILSPSKHDKMYEQCLLKKMIVVTYFSATRMYTAIQPCTSRIIGYQCNGYKSNLNCNPRNHKKRPCFQIYWFAFQFTQTVTLIDWTNPSSNPISINEP